MGGFFLKKGGGVERDREARGEGGGSGRWTEGAMR